MSSRLPLPLALVALLLAGAAASAAEPFRITVTQLDASRFPSVRLVVDVLDAEGRPVRGLTAADLLLSEEGSDRPARVDLASEVAPVALAIALDTSGSMVGRPLADAKQAIRTTIQTLGPRDQAALVTFSGTVTVAQRLTADQAALLGATDSAVARGFTAIYDAVLAAAELLERVPANARRAVVLLTDGVDNASTVDAATALARVKGLGYPIFVVVLGRELDLELLGELAAASRGGRVLPAAASADLAGIYASLSEQIKSEYTVEYLSALTSLRDGAPVSLDLRLTRDGRVVARTAAAFVVPAGRGVAVPSPSLAPPVPAVEPSGQPLAVAPAPATAPSADLEITPVELALAVALLGAATVLLLVLGIREISLRDRSEGRARSRVRRFAPAGTTAGEGPAERRSLGERLVKPLLRAAAAPLAPALTERRIGAIQERLLHAGEPFELSAEEYLGLRALAAVGGLLLALALVAQLGLDGQAVLALAVGFVLLGSALPALWLGYAGQRRKQAMLRALPSTLDILALSMEAGLAFDGAIAHVAQRWNNPLSHEFRRWFIELQMGRPRRQAMAELAKRTGVDEVQRFVASITQAEALGVPVVKVLRDNAAELRVLRRQRAEGLARTAPVKMVFPMVLLVFPALFIVLLGPAVPRLISIFSLTPP